MSDTASNIATGTTVAGISIVAAKIDIPFAILILVFFSIMHSIIILHYSKKLDFLFDSKDFILSSMIAFTLWIISLMFGVWKDYSELQIYIAVSIVCLVWIKIMDLATYYIKSKFWIDVEVKDLFDNERKWKRK